jgi:hypothetical protein
MKDGDTSASFMIHVVWRVRVGDAGLCLGYWRLQIGNFDNFLKKLSRIGKSYGFSKVGNWRLQTAIIFFRKLSRAKNSNN